MHSVLTLMGPVSDFEQFTLCVSSGGRNVTAFISVHSTHAGARNAMIKKKAWNNVGGLFPLIYLII